MQSVKEAKIESWKATVLLKVRETDLKLSRK